MNRFQVINTPLSGLKLIQRQFIGDTRGFLSRIFCQQELAVSGWHTPIAQVNHTYTARCGTVRGMHYQLPPYCEMKLVQCLHGEVWDVAVDMRSGSTTFLHWHGEKLSAENGMALLIPEGFAHGFQTLSNDVEMIYCHSAPYEAKAEGGFSPTDPRLAINWPLEIAQLSPRDLLLPPINDQFTGIQP